VVCYKDYFNVCSRTELKDREKEDWKYPNRSERNLLPNMDNGHFEDPAALILQELLIVWLLNRTSFQLRTAHDARIHTGGCSR